MKEPDNTPEFEDALSELEQLVTQMEEGEMSLEESLKAFERGILLTRHCQQALTSAEQRVRVLQEENGEITESDFNEAALDDSSSDAD